MSYCAWRLFPVRHGPRISQNKNSKMFEKLEDIDHLGRFQTKVS